ncbi:MAG: hypothetical protein Q8Q25_01950 [bacterium]|nr:hypothetical protein [bacterium]
MFPSKRYFSVLMIMVTAYSGANAMHVDENAVFIPGKLGKLALIHHGKRGFSVESASGSKQIQPCFVDKELRGIPSDRLAKLLAIGGYLSVNKMNNSEDYSVRLQGRVNGGGPLLASAFYWGTKALCYGTFFGGAAAVIPATGGLAAAIPSMALAGLSTSTGAGIVATGIATVGLAPSAALASGTVLAASAGTVTTVVAGVETAATVASAIGMAIPFL